MALMLIKTTAVAHPPPPRPVVAPVGFFMLRFLFDRTEDFRNILEWDRYPLEE